MITPTQLRMAFPGAERAYVAPSASRKGAIVFRIFYDHDKRYGVTVNEKRLKTFKTDEELLAYVVEELQTARRWWLKKQAEA